MSDTNLLQLAAEWRKVPHITVPLERELWNSFRTWEPSWQTQNLASEALRELFVELVSFRWNKKCHPFEIVCDVNKEQAVPKRLSTIVIEYLAESFDGGPDPSTLSCSQLLEFGSLLNPGLPLLKTIEIESETYWRRVVWCHSSDTLSYFEHDYLTPARFWKHHGVELKLARMFEAQDPRYWELEGLEETVKKVAPYVSNLVIEQLMPYPSMEPIEHYETYSFCNAPEALCHHGSLDILRHLTNLTTLSLVFGVKNWTKGYQDRYSSCSLTDIDNLGLGLQKLEKLKKFNLSLTRLNPAKLKLLLEHLTPLHLDTIRLTRCQLGKGCGGILGRFLSRFGPTLKHLNLADNGLDATELDQLCPGFSVYRGVVDSLDLSYNPIGESGVLILGGAIKGRAQLSDLNFAGCQMGVEGSFRVIQLLSFHATLRNVSLNCVPISPAGAEKLVQVLKENKHIVNVQVRECGLSEAAMMKVRNILAKNAKRRNRLPSEEWTRAADMGTDRCIRSRASMYMLERQAFPTESKNHQ